MSAPQSSKQISDKYALGLSRSDFRSLKLPSLEFGHSIAFAGESKSLWFAPRDIPEFDTWQFSLPEGLALQNDT